MRKGIDILMEWVDEMAQRHQRQEAMLKDLAERALTPPEPDDTPITIRWACPKPTDPPTRVLYTQGMAFRREELEPGFGDLLRLLAKEALM